MKTYYCNSSMKFNLDSMYTHLQILRYDFESGDLTGTVECCGRKVDRDTIYDLCDEVADLLGKAVGGKVTGKEYGRIREIAEERQWMRYFSCINHGMSENDAAYAFTD